MYIDLLRMYTTNQRFKRDCTQVFKIENRMLLNLIDMHARCRDDDAEARIIWTTLICQGHEPEDRSRLQVPVENSCWQQDRDYDIFFPKPLSLLYKLKELKSQVNVKTGTGTR